MAKKQKFPHFENACEKVKEYLDSTRVSHRPITSKTISFQSKIDKARAIIIRSRKAGQKSTLLQDALINPNVTIISATLTRAKELEIEYIRLFQNLSWWRKIIWGLKGLKYPVFESLDSSSIDYSKPVVLDAEIFL